MAASVGCRCLEVEEIDLSGLIHLHHPSRFETPAANGMTVAALALHTKAGIEKAEAGRHWTAVVFVTFDCRWRAVPASHSLDDGFCMLSASHPARIEI